MGSIDNEADGMVLDFIETSREALDDIETGLIDLEKDTSNVDILNEIFRTIHSIKGTAGFLAFDKVVALAHSGEELLNKLRKGELEVNSEMIDIILNANDGLRDLIASLSKGNGEEVDIEPLVAAINKVL